MAVFWIVCWIEIACLNKCISSPRIAGSPRLPSYLDGAIRFRNKSAGNEVSAWLQNGKDQRRRPLLGDGVTPAAFRCLFHKLETAPVRRVEINTDLDRSRPKNGYQL